MDKTTTNLEIAQTIQEQLGNGAIAMMGAKNFLAVENGLSFRIGRNASGWSGITISLDPSDTADVKFWKMRKKDHVPTVVREHEESGIYADQLHQTIERNTGLYLSL